MGFTGLQPARQADSAPPSSGVSSVALLTAGVEPKRNQLSGPAATWSPSACLPIRIRAPVEDTDSDLPHHPAGPRIWPEKGLASSCCVACLVVGPRRRGRLLPYNKPPAPNDSRRGQVASSWSSVRLSSGLRRSGFGGWASARFPVGRAFLSVGTDSVRSTSTQPRRRRSGWASCTYSSDLGSADSPSEPEPSPRP
jgi:hypothetical protein